MYVFDLDGTLAPFGKPVSREVANAVNKLGHVHIISGNSMKRMKAATKLIKNKTLVSIGDLKENFKLDLASAFNVSKDSFGNDENMQIFRKNICLQLRKFDKRIYIGGRSTIDFMAINKSMIANIEWKKVTYFYDNKWAMNSRIHNDVPVIAKAKRAIRTDYTCIIKDIENAQKS